MVKKNIFKNLNKYILPVILTLVLLAVFAVFVFAVPMENTNVRAPTNGVNASGAITTLFNVTFINVSAETSTGDVTNITFDTLNVSFWISNFSTGSGWYLIGNASTCVNMGAGAIVSGKIFATNVSCWGTLNASAFYGDAANLSGNGSKVPDGSYRINATIWNGSDGAYGKPMISTKLGNLTNITIDNTQPGTVQPIRLPGGQNHSTTSLAGNLTLNVTVVDTGNLINFVQFHIINATGQVNASYTATRENDTTYSTRLLNTSHFRNGKYNITIHVNDTVGNRNITANSTTSPPVKTLIFDNTAPTITYSCSPSKVNTGDTVTCSCSGSATSNINSTDFTEKPSTTSTGTFTQTCTVTSLSGLSTSESVTYTVEQSTGGSTTSTATGGGGTSAVTWSTTVPKTDKELSEKGEVTQSLGSKERVSIKVSGESHFVGVVSLTTTTATIEVSSTPQTVTMNIGESKKFELTGDNFYDVLVTLKSITANKADVAISSINEEIPAAEPEETQEEGTEAGAGEGEAAGALGSKSGKIILIVVILIIIIAAVVWYVMRKR